MADSSKEKALQARVSADFAKRFNLVARARGKTTSELVREAVERLMEDAQGDLEALRADLRRKYREEQRALGLIPDEDDDVVVPAPAPVTAPPVPVGAPAGAQAVVSSTAASGPSPSPTPADAPSLPSPASAAPDPSPASAPPAVAAEPPSAPPAVAAEPPSAATNQPTDG